MKMPFWRINNRISAKEVRVISSEDKQVGVMQLSEALELAQKEGLDLVEIASKANPPVVKVIDFGKFRYREEKKLKSEKKKNKSVELKEVRFTPFMGPGDYQTRLARVTEFLDEGRKVRITVVFKGRQMKSQKFGYLLLKRLFTEYGERIRVEMEAKFIGRHLITVIAPVGKKKEVKNAKTEDKKISN